MRRKQGVQQVRVTPPPSSPPFDSASSDMSSQATPIQGSRPVTPPLPSAGSPRSPESLLPPACRQRDRSPSPMRGYLIPSPLPTRRNRTCSASARAAEGPVFSGVCKYFSRSKGHGFITPADGGKDIFVHISDFSCISPAADDTVKKMDVLVLLLLLLTPVCVNGLKYIRYSGDDATTWARAQNYCRTHHTDLVTIRDAAENDYREPGWIGLYRENASSPWKWSRENEIADFIIWKEEPHPSGNCAVKRHSDGKWRPDHCNDKRSFMCFDEKLFLVKQNKTWEEALEHCRSLQTLDPNPETAPYQNHRFDLATLITPEDHDLARDIAQKATTESVWTGLRYLGDQWMWVSGEPVTYETISICPGPKSCGVLEKDGDADFKIAKCHKRRNFLCSLRP